MASGPMIVTGSDPALTQCRTDGGGIVGIYQPRVQAAHDLDQTFRSARKAKQVGDSGAIGTPMRIAAIRSERVIDAVLCDGQEGALLRQRISRQVRAEPGG